MRKILLFIIILTSTVTYCQKSGIIKDSLTNEPIPFVNIWIENENIGTTSNENGKFILPSYSGYKNLVFSAIGYKTKVINSNLTDLKIILIPEIIELKEIVIISKNQTSEKTIGKFNKSKINFYFAGSIKPWIIARYFPYNQDYDKYSHLKTIKFLTKSDVKDSKFNLRFYSIGKNGEPENYIYNQNIFGIAKKGKSITEIDISYLNIQFPKTGFFIAVEWLILEQNKHEYKYTKEHSREKYNGISYEPSFGIEPGNNDENCWIYNQGKWRKTWKHNANLKNYIDKYDLLAIELTLTN